MKLLFTYLFLCLMCIAQTAYPQAPERVNTTAPITINGVVTDAAGKPVADLSVTNDTDKTLGLTNKEGRFTVTTTNGSRLHVSGIGFATHTFTANPNNAAININIKPDSKNMDEVVVTALGITRREKSLGYATQTLDSKAMNDARSNNWSDALNGKIAGVNLTSSGSGPVNSTRINLRGDVSLNPNNNSALIVVDGVPVNSDLTTSGVENAYGAGSGNDVPIDFGNGISNINPDDIESVTTLKGPGATALYGSRAANGAVLITTKSGAAKKNGIGVTFNSNTSVNTVLKWPDYQYQYGQGTGKALNTAGQFYYSYGASADGASTSGTSSAFGPKFNGQMYYQFDPVRQGQGLERTLWRPYTDNIKGFWRTGSTFTNNISLEGGNDKNSGRVSVTHSKNEWIMPNTGYERISVQTSFSLKVSERLKISSKINYTNMKSDNLPATGYNNQSIAYFMIFQNPNVNLKWYEARWKNGQEGVDQLHPYSSFIDNPYLIAYEMTNAVRKNNVIGTVSANYNINKNFDLMLRTALDLTTDKRQQKRPFSTANFLKGYYRTQNIMQTEINSDFLLSYHMARKSKLTFNASIGANNRTDHYDRVDGYVDGLVIPGVYKLSNGLASPTMLTFDRNKTVNSVYGLASVGYKNIYFLDVTGRNDWSSTLPQKNWSFFYPSVNAAVVLSDAFRLPAVVSFAKLRLSAAQAGNDTDPYQTTKYYGTSEFPSSGSVNTTLFNANLKPEIATSYEAGLDVRFFKGRLGLDLTYYSNRTKNQLATVPLDPTTGYQYAFVNVGEVGNKGVEVILKGQPVKSKNFNWSTTITWSKNKNKVLSLADGVTSKDIAYGGNATIRATVGGSTGDIWGFGFVRDPQGNIVYTAAGLPARPAEIKYIGNAYADWKGGIQNEFSYKNYRISFLIDGQYGGLIYSQTHHKSTEQGKLQHTLAGREENYIIGVGVVDDGTGHYVPNTKKVLPVDYYADYYRRANVEANSFDASYVKLRELRLDYTLTSAVLGKSFIKSASVGLYGRDLFMITSFPIFDPQTASSLNGGTLVPGVEMGQLPSTTTMGINLTLKF
ncbi:SusC/RagA family TonB-linked outer membrane protein [Ferruginibacter sp. HRS2-29]|uniref:SusC/RagA family TonB-linked outer membrane protein n=1 Tax=Ferruginibacter sp. HRS2-29 TaxID=2487334 RepID=UPI0020CE8B4D|nr:SusC/RagA family TonB-linked outer membrane protein [Ferruginibacter sp. HRS2-29]MCP9753360.1 SusC/RagA family TonB-linked outer membrane protein [Ferruginibacter sp. HRS2-29]